MFIRKTYSILPSDAKRKQVTKPWFWEKGEKPLFAQPFLMRELHHWLPFCNSCLGVRYFWKLLASFLHLISEMSLPFCILFYDVSCTSFLLTLLYLRNRCHRLYHIALKRCGVWKLEKQAKKKRFWKNVTCFLFASDGRSLFTGMYYNIVHFVR